VGDGRWIKLGRARPSRVGRTESNKGRRFREPFPAYSAGDDETYILNAGPESTASPSRASRPCRRQTGDGDEKPVSGAERDGAVEYDPSTAVYGAQGTGVEGRRRYIDAE